MGKMNELSVLAWNAGIKTEFKEVGELKLHVAKQLLLCNLQANYQLALLAVKFGLGNKTQEEIAREYTGLTIQQAMCLPHGTVLHHYQDRNADGTPVRVRVNGKCQTWKTRPENYRVPVVQGFKNYGEITQVNGWQWFIP